MTLDQIEAMLDAWVEKNHADFGIKLETAHGCAWSAELRLTLKPNNPDGPDRSTVLMSCGHADPLTALDSLMTSFAEFADQAEQQKARPPATWEAIAHQFANDTRLGHLPWKAHDAVEAWLRAGGKAAKRLPKECKEGYGEEPA